jgi:predicted RNase H-like nuclease
MMARPGSRAVLGIDAAWTPTQPSGVALVREELSGWRLVAVASSYRRFCDQGSYQLEDHTLPDPSALLAAASKLCGQVIDLVAVDMPLSRGPIVGRRVSDDCVSRAYGARKCGTHSPSAARPGPLSDALWKGFGLADYPLLTENGAVRGLIEVYPHPALVELAGADERLPYKASKVRNYWPSAKASDRRDNLYRQWREIVGLLETQIRGVAGVLPPLPNDATRLQMKAHEDMLDAIVCAWVGTCFLEGTAIAFGDADSAIWIPAPASAQASLPSTTA